jgi:hypothetical protein
MIDFRHSCADPECITDAYGRVEKELRDGERLWLVEQSKEGRWSASAAVERTEESKIYPGVEEKTLVNVGYGKGNTLYQALSTLYTNIKLRHIQQDEKGRA